MESKLYKTYYPNMGEFVYHQRTDGAEVIYISGGGNSSMAYLDRSSDTLIMMEVILCSDSTRPANEEEKQLILSKLHEIGKDWDAEKKEIVEYRWKPKGDEQYWYISDILIIDDSYWDDDEYDYCRMDAGNCFRTREAAQAMADKFKKLLKGGKE